MWLKFVVYIIFSIQILLAQEEIQTTDAAIKWCNSQSRNVSTNVWTYYTGFFCYNYTNDYRLNFRYNYSVAKLNGESVPVGIIEENGTEKMFPYDYENKNYSSIVRKSFKTDDFFNTWIDCCQEAVDCCYNVMTNENIVPTSDYECPVIWDAWSCFPQAKANTVSKLRCSKQAYSNTASFCILFSQKQCTEDGWNPKTNYDVCAIAPVYRNRYYFHIDSLIVGSALSFPALVVFFSFVKFRKTLRVICHRNLILVVIVRNTLTILTKELILLDALKTSDSNNVMVSNGVGCRILAFFENAAKNGMYACMLADGYYLHKLIVRTFATEPRMYFFYGILVGITFIPSLIWAIKKGVSGGDQCWMVDTGSDQWISDGVRIAILVLNILLLCDIIRNMLLKRRSKNPTKQAKETLRASLFLMPLFGVHILLITNREMFGQQPTCDIEDIYYYLSYTLEGAQSVLVAITFCYLNSEVHAELKNAYRKFLLHLEQRYGWRLRRPTIFQRRETAATFVDANNKNQVNLRTQRSISEVNIHFNEVESEI